MLQLNPTRPASRNNDASPTSHRLAISAALLVVVTFSSGCTKLPSTRKLDLMSPSSSILFPGQRNPASRYRMADGSEPALAADGSMSMEAYQKIREAKANHSVVLQVDGDDQPVRVLPLPPENKSAFVSELLSQTGLLKRFGAVDVVLYRPSPESISGVRMQVQFRDDGTIDPTTDYGLRAGDRIRVTKVDTSPFQMMMDLVLQR